MARPYFVSVYAEGEGEAVIEGQPVHLGWSALTYWPWQESWVSTLKNRQPAAIN